MNKQNLIAIAVLLAVIVTAVILFNGPATIDSNKPADASNQGADSHALVQDTDGESKLSQSKPMPEDAATVSAIANFSTMSKLAKYPGFGHQIDKDEDTFTKEELERESMISDCMKESGFEYTPAPSIVLDDAAMSDEEEFERLLREAATDPNDEYISTLSPSMKESYYITLTGMADPNAEEGTNHSLAADSDSCIHRAYTSVPGVYAKRNQLNEEYEAMEAGIGDDERVIAATEKWSNCMSDSGHTYLNPGEVQSHIDQSIADNGLNQDSTVTNSQQTALEWFNACKIQA